MFIYDIKLTNRSEANKNNKPNYKSSARKVGGQSLFPAQVKRIFSRITLSCVEYIPDNINWEFF